MDVFHPPLCVQIRDLSFAARLTARDTNRMEMQRLD